FADEKGSLLNNAIFSSDRGAGCCLETYTITKQSRTTQLTGMLRECQPNIPVANAEVVLKDASGKTWTTTTDKYGQYTFDIGSAPYTNMTLTINKDAYLESTPFFQISSVDESNLLVTKANIPDACIEKKPEQKLVIKVEDVVTVYFDFDKSILKTPTIQKLDSIYTVMVEYPASTIQISGYTDGRGTEKYNAVLSDKRARACADYLVKKGIDKARITFVSFGACCPVEMELLNGMDNAEGRSRNRRALINVKKD
ncbi:MAG: OmpA family protein, partial [Chitinophagaceae bacterium]